jgi:isoleucyl-tRNA synthetase
LSLKRSMTVDGEGRPSSKTWSKDDDSSKNPETNTDDDVLIILDATLYPELANEGLAREIINRVRRLRKKASLQPTDDVKMEYEILSGPDNIGLGNIFTSQAKMIEKALRRPVYHHEIAKVQGEIPNGIETSLIIQEEEIQRAIFTLSLMKL